MVPEGNQESQDEHDLSQELEQARAGSTKHQNFARERNTPGQPRVLREDVGTGIQRLEYAVPDEIAAQHEGPVIWQRNPDDVAEDQHQDSHGEKRIQQGPDKPQQRSLVLDLEIAN